MSRIVRKVASEQALGRGSNGGAAQDGASSPLVSRLLFDGPIATPAATGTLPPGVTSIASDIPLYTVGARVGVGAQVLFTVAYSGTTAAADSTLGLSNGGTATLVSGGGTASAIYSYSVGSDAQATSSLFVTSLNSGGTSQAASVDALVAIDPTISSPSDTYFAGEWYLNSQYGTHADQVWADYTGKGVTVAVFDNGIEYAHPDLAGNVNVDLGYDPQTDTHNGNGVTTNGDPTQEPNSGDGNLHGTAVAGLIAAGRNGFGSVGTAYGATLYSIFHNYAATGDPAVQVPMYVNAYNDAALHADIMNNSWGNSGGFYNKFTTDPESQVAAALANAATNGRNGLGTIIVQSAGNSGEYRADTNGSNFSNSRFDIVVGASGQNGGQYSFSTRGASILVSAPGGAEITTDRLGTPGYSTSGGDYTDTPDSQFYGTSGSAPVTSGVIALMLQANAKLGARDVQEILAYSAQPSQYALSYASNHAGNWNNGGLNISNDIGFGILDARAAVRLAETWQTQKTWGNVVSQTVSSDPGITANIVGKSTASASTTLHIDGHQSIDRVDLYVDIDATRNNIVSILLTSPDGTVSTLLDRYGTAATSNTISSQLGISGGTGAGIHYTLDSTQFMGEDAAGDWTVTIKTTGAVSNSTAYNTTLTHASLTVYGDGTSTNSTYYYTDAYANSHNGTTLTDSDGGYDTINAAAVTAASVIDLSGATASSIGGTPLTIADDHVVTVFGGDGGDTITANGLNDTLCGERGNDTLLAGSGVCLLEGGRGDDLLVGTKSGLAIGDFSGAFASYTLTRTTKTDWTVADTIGTDGTDTLRGVGVTLFADGAYLLNRDGTTARLFGADATVTLAQTGLVITDTAADISANLVAVAGLIDAAPAGTIDYIASIAFTDAAPQLALTADDYQAFLDINETFVGNYVTVETLADGSTATSDWTGDVAHHTSFADANGIVTSVETYHLSAPRYDETISYFAPDGRRTEVDYELAGVVNDIDLFAADGTRERISYFTDRAYTEEDRYYDAGNALVRDVKTGITGAAYTSLTTLFDANGAMTEQLTSGYTGGSFSSRDRLFDANGFVTTDTLIGYGGNAGTTLALHYDTAHHLTEADYSGLVGRSYTDLDRTYDVTTSKVVQDVFTNYANTPGETLTTSYDGNGNRSEMLYTGLAGRAYTSLDRKYDATGHLLTDTRAGFTGTDYSSSTTFYAASGAIDHTSFALTAGNHRIVGTAGNDVLSGATGDILVGGAGADRFVIDVESLAVQDFSRKQGDTFDLSPLLEGATDGHFLGTAAFDGLKDAVRYDVVNGSALVSIDFDGDKSADLGFTVSKTTTLNTNDFLFVAPV